MRRKPVTTLILICIVAVIFTLLCVNISAAEVDSGTCGDNLTWTLDDAGTLTISGTGEMDDNWSRDSTPWYSYRSSVKSVVIGDSITTIGTCAFIDCDSLTSVSIPDSVTTVDSSAFYCCTSLTDVYYAGTEDDWNAISIGSYNDPLTNATINYNYVPEDEFVASGTCGDNLTWTLDENGVLKISGAGAMTDWSRYSDVPWYSYISSIKSVNIGDSVTNIGSSAFSGCSNLISIDIGDSVTTIGSDAFSYCDSLTSVDIGDSVTTIGIYAFYYCTSLTNVVIPDSVTTIGGYAFGCCTSLTSMDIGDNVTSISSYTLWHCDSLTSITVDENNTEYSIDERGVLFNKEKTVLEKYPSGNPNTSYTIPDGVTCVSTEAFSYCSHLTSVIIPDSVTVFGHFPFSGCSSLTDVYYTGSESEWNNIWFESDDLCSDATIHYNYSPYACGDINCDGIVNVFDSIMLVRIIAGLSGYADIELSLGVADLDLSGTINSVDSTILFRHLAGWSGYDVIPLA